jgi:biopolymer transport protein TolQ
MLDNIDNSSDAGMTTTAAFSLLDTLLHANGVVQGVIVLLLLLSVYSWGVIIRSYSVISSQKSRVAKLNRVISSDGIEKLRVPSRSRNACIATNVMAYATKALQNKGDAEKQEFRRFLEEGMRVEIDRALFAQEKRLSGLANIASLSPFIGLFGTIIGIMHSFSSIFATQSASLKVIAPSISEALFATAVGIIVAIPAGMFYNKLLGDSRHLRREAEALVCNFSKCC